MGGWWAALWSRHRGGEGDFLYFVTVAELACFHHFYRHLLTNPVRYTHDYIKLLKSIVPWSAMGKQTAQDNEVCWARSYKRAGIGTWDTARGCEEPGLRSLLVYTSHGYSLNTPRIFWKFGKETMGEWERDRLPPVHATKRTRVIVWAEEMNHQRVLSKTLHCGICLEFRLATKYNGFILKNEPGESVYLPYWHRWYRFLIVTKTLVLNTERS